MNIDDDIVMKYLFKECSDEELKLLNQWLSAGEENRRELFTMEALFNAGRLKRYADPQFLQGEKAKLFEQIKKEAAGAKRRRWNKRMMQFAAAVFLAVLLAVGIHCFHVHNSTQTVCAGQGGVEQLTLPDGTKVWLNKSTQLRYPKQFNGKTRRVFMEGEAYFEVTENKKQAFVVETENLEITVLGTVFNVISSKERDREIVTLLEGEVQIKGQNTEGLILLSPGQEAGWDKSTHRFHVKELNNASLNAVWHDGLIPFRQASIEDIKDVLEQLYGVKVHIDPAVSRTITYSGVLKNQDSLQEMLRLLKNAIPIDYEINGKEVYLLMVNG